MPHEFIVKAGSYNECLYFILEGEAVIFGLGNQLLAIMRAGSHFNVDIGQIDPAQIYHGKRILHIVSTTQTAVAIVEK